MTDLSLSLEFYPKLSAERLDQARKTIQQNQSHWEAPFFMDIYTYADVSAFEKVCRPYLNDPHLEHLIILGTGGSYQTLKALELLSHKKIHFLTSSRPNELSRCLAECPPEKSLVIPISRAGKTLDINSILGLFQKYKILALSSQGPMFDLVKKLNATIIDVPDLSGRYAASVCSVAIVPALLAGIDVKKFQAGLDHGYSKFKDLQNSKNIALQYAAFLLMLYNNGYRNIFSMPYSEWLEGAAGLFVQEISESSGKEGKGLLGTMQPAPLCQHSVLELILGGSKGHTSPLLWTTLNEPVDVPLIPIEPELEGQTGLSVINYQLDATFQALCEQSVPAAKLSMKAVDAFSLGELIAFVQTTLYYFCLLLDVNWSSNPLVNTGKKICNEALAKRLDLDSRINARIAISEKHFKELDL
jgi:glucose-6-phosphate isomerase